MDIAKFQQFAIVDGNINRRNDELIFPLDALYRGCVTA